MTPTERLVAETEHLNELLDEAGLESFPASDPPAVTPRRAAVELAPETRRPPAHPTDPATAARPSGPRRKTAR